MVDPNNKGRDKRLRNADFFNVVKFPQMTFKSASVKKGKKPRSSTRNAVPPSTAKTLAPPNAYPSSSEG